MKNPFVVLGVHGDASREQIDAAYKEKLRMYQELGQSDRIDELNAAYDYLIMHAGETLVCSDSGYQSVTDYSDIRAKINSGRLDDAQTLLDGMPDYSRDAQWYYLKGTVQQKRGWLEEAAKNFATASNLDPSNNTYKMAYNKINNARSGGYRTERRAEKNSGCSGCDMCTGLICADCCCECCGGDLIPCC
ncbi:MAG: molecular chaperone DnaJ [Clostridia bacterium]|nr:molecular chaperone DnaJ [Clostridia bacterium]